ncbi:hypothetical protein [Bradyrhizobium sp. 25ACV]
MTERAQSFEAAREQFETAWARFPTLSEEQFERWRRDRDFHAWKRRMWDTGKRLPTQNTDRRARCFCGEAADFEPHIQGAHRGIGA